MGPDSLASADIKGIIVDAIKQGIAAGLQQSRQPASLVLVSALAHDHDMDPMIQRDYPDLPEPLFAGTLSPESFSGFGGRSQGAGPFGRRRDAT